MTHSAHQTSVRYFFAPVQVTGKGNDRFCPTCSNIEITWFATSTLHSSWMCCCVNQCALSRKVVGSIPLVSLWLPGDSTLTEITTIGICCGVMRPVFKANKLTTFMCQSSRNFGRLNLLKTQWPFCNCNCNCNCNFLICFSYKKIKVHNGRFKYNSICFTANWIVIQHWNIGHSGLFVGR